MSAPFWRSTSYGAGYQESAQMSTPILPQGVFRTGTSLTLPADVKGASSAVGKALRARATAAPSYR